MDFEYFYSLKNVSTARYANKVYKITSITDRRVWYHSESKGQCYAVIEKENKSFIFLKKVRKNKLSEKIFSGKVRKIENDFIYVEAL